VIAGYAHSWTADWPGGGDAIPTFRWRWLRCTAAFQTIWRYTLQSCSCLSLVRAALVMCARLSDRQAMLLWAIPTVWCWSSITNTCDKDRA
jgi:hypothetical protein